MEILNESNIIVFGGGASFQGFCTGNYRFFKGADPFDRFDKNFIAKPITDYINQVDMTDTEEIKSHINLLVLALGLTYKQQNGLIPFAALQEEQAALITAHNNFNRYFYYDLQDAVYK